MAQIFYPPRPLANPTASVGLTAVNGTSSSAMRADGAPPLDQTAAFAFTGLGNTTLLSASQLKWSTDLILTRAGAATLNLGAAAGDTTGTSQTVQAQGVTTGGTNNQAGGNLTIASGQGKGNVASILVLSAPTPGGSGNTLQTVNPVLTLVSAGAAQGQIYFGSTGVNSNVSIQQDSSSLNFIIGGNSAFYMNNNGAPGGGNIRTLGTRSNYLIGWAPSTDPTVALDTILSRGGAPAALQLGAAAADTTGVSQTLQAQGVTTGGTNNQAGGSLTIQPGQGKGTAISALNFNSPVALGSGNTLQTQTRSFAAKNGSLVVGPGSALATTATDGFIYVAGGAGPPTGTPTANTGAVAIYYDTTNDQLYAYNGSWKQPKTPAAAAIVNWQ